MLDIATAGILLLLLLWIGFQIALLRAARMLSQERKAFGPE